MPATATTFRAPDGQELTCWHWPEETGRPTLHWAHATGFHGRAYAPLLDRLSTSLNIQAWDMRGHGASDGECEATSWQVFYDDFKAFLETQEAPIWVAGHSVGGMTTLAGAAGASRRVAGILLVEPVLLDVLSGAILALAKRLGVADRLGHAAGAARRRPSFSSKADALANFRTKRAFARWPDEWLEAYVEHGFLEADAEVALACQPAWESLTFTNTEHWPWPHLRALGRQVPVRILAGSRGSTFPKLARILTKLMLPQAEIEVLPEASHFLPMENSEFLHDWIRQQVGLCYNGG